MTAEPVRALVTRPAEDAGPLCRRLRALGIAPVAEPLLAIEPDGGRSLDLAGAQAVLVTSRNGARALAAATPARDVAVLAVGDATADTARAAGFTNVLSAGGASGDLERLVGARLDPDGGRLVHAAGETAAGDLAAALSAKGFTVDREVLYKAVPATALTATTAALISEARLAMALFFSPRTAAIFAALARADGLEAACAAVLAVFISPAASHEARALPWRGAWCAASPDMAGFIEAVAAARRAIGPTRDENG